MILSPPLSIAKSECTNTSRTVGDLNTKLTSAIMTESIVQIEITGRSLSTFS